MSKAARILYVCTIAFLFAFTASASVTDFVKRYDNLRLGESFSATDFRFTIGHATFTLPSGTVSVVTAGDEKVGLFLAGTGTYTYQSATKDEFTAIRYNAKNADVKLQESADAIGITDTFNSVLILGTQLPSLSGAAAGAPWDSFSEHRQLFVRQRFTPPLSHSLALAGDGGRVVEVEVKARRPFIYEYDGAWSHSETFVLLRPPQFRTESDKNVLYPLRLSEQPVGRDARDAPAASLQLTDLDVTLVASDGTDATLTVVETVVPKRPINVARFTLYNAFFFDINREPRYFIVRSITDSDGKKLSFDHQAGDLIVDVKGTAGQPLKLRFEIDGNFLYRPEGSNYWELGIAPWFPFTGWNSQHFTYHSLIKVKKPFVPFTSGKTIRREVEGDYNLLETRIDKPVSAVAILAGKYQFDEETKNGVTVRVASFLSKNTTAYKQLRSIAFSAIDYFPTFLGPFPFDEITVIEKNDLGYGQAPPGIVFITKEAFTPKLGAANDFVRGINMRFVHEIAHQYWGHAVAPPSSEEEWLSEAFAEYSAALFMKASKRSGDYDNALATWRANAREATKVATIPMSNRLENPKDWVGAALIRSYLLYSKGAFLLAALHRELGDQMFLTFLKSYQRSFRWQYGTTKDVIGILQFLTKKDYAPFFEQYYYDTAMPELK
ncbi:MAG: M1 family aminopeptidase [Acidobacteriota bacterium]